MGQSANRDEINTLFGVVANGIKGNTTTRLCFITMCDNVNRLLGVRNSEIIEHDAIYAAMIENLLQFIKRAYLNFYL